MSTASGWISSIYSIFDHDHHHNSKQNADQTHEQVEVCSDNVSNDQLNPSRVDTNLSNIECISRKTEQSFSLQRVVSTLSISFEKPSETFLSDQDIDDVTHITTQSLSTSLTNHEGDGEIRNSKIRDSASIEANSTATVIPITDSNTSGHSDAKVPDNTILLENVDDITCDEEGIEWSRRQYNEVKWFDATPTTIQSDNKGVLAIVNRTTSTPLFRHLRSFRSITFGKHTGAAKNAIVPVDHQKQQIFEVEEANAVTSTPSSIWRNKDTFESTDKSNSVCLDTCPSLDAITTTSSHDSQASTDDETDIKKVPSTSDNESQPCRSRSVVRYVIAIVLSLLVCIATGFWFSRQGKANPTTLNARASEAEPPAQQQPGLETKENTTLTTISNVTVSSNMSSPTSFNEPNLTSQALQTTLPTISPTSSMKPSSSPIVQQQVVNFLAIGDIPYDTAQERILRYQMDEIHDYYIENDIDFMVHVGDYRKNDGDCELDQYTVAADLLRRSPVPVFVLPGDNDWTNCRNGWQVGYNLWYQTFKEFESNWEHNFTIHRLDGYPETFTFVHKNVLFIGLNIAGDYPISSSEEDEWSTRLTIEVEWVKELIQEYLNDLDSWEAGRVVIFGHANPKSSHAEFFDPLAEYIDSELDNSVPILYMNGDLHEWQVNSNFYDNPSWLRIIVSGEGRDPPTLMSINYTGEWQDPDEAFVYNRQH